MKPALTLIVELFNTDTEEHSMRVIRHTKSTLKAVIRNAAIERKRIEDGLLPLIVDAMRIENADEEVVWRSAEVHS